MGGHSHRVQSPLRREVELPRKGSVGLTVILIASASMFFSVWTSALLLQSRMSHRCYHRQAPVMVTRSLRGYARPAPQLAIAVEKSSPDECGRASYHSNPDGSLSVVFDSCAAPSPR